MKLTAEGNWRFAPGEHLTYIILWILLCAGVGWLFYDAVLFSVFGWPAYPLFAKIMRKHKENRYRQRMELEFKDVMMSVYSSLSAGATVEQSLKRAKEDMERNLGKSSRMTIELGIICRKMERNISVGQCLEDMAIRCKVEAVENFTQVIMIGKRQGNNLAALVRDNVDKIQNRIETAYEIEALIGAKRNEFGFMCIIPAGIILYMRLFSPAFMSVLYRNAAGVILMTACLGVYIGAGAMGMQILRIEI